ncbi:MAG: DUF1236 domain-containing protein [Chelatococcus sp.]|jgi:hypothetical protein|uniref:DUF1236 domain-containing protein n=1 Tax=unclassified Chelatococcus TaxID=2638111 RepID=UPI001BCDD866|nr:MULTISPECIES: DUF1236 domain-containing protein [unclassified Chelatococcus]CAH1673419.1 conserved exported hypothetical protein [Hyphomicrobiales bacterium]MBS7738825.1 DUF1236 domain-containing protein [Chelatococcus sp. HY11]MBX3539587.1 DUF1236 domain-containing protein [Chelatococcus sp.]MBX3547274.1 DUF1236 domain-containing protein [Chelatococcus sp.]MCO5076644.1 DUF1236 domain-containing protein [Chelatococcus sp.]
MKRLALVAMLTVIPTLAMAQNPQGAQGGAAGGAAAGAVGGAVVGGPVGAVVGGVGGALVGGIIGDSTPRFQQYVVTQRVPSYTYQDELQVGTVLPDGGIVYHEVPPEYGVRDYRYTVINNRTVLVDPRTRRVVQIIE